MTRINQLAHELMPEVVKFRRDIHRHPELSMKERRTTERVCAKLQELGISYRRTGDVGVIAEIHGEKGPGATVMLRADMDALPIQEKTGLPFASECDGVMHACGHDVNTAMLIGAASILQRLKDEFRGTVRLVFQPAEESTEGARYMIDHGALEGVDMCFAAHVHPNWPEPNGAIVTKRGQLFAACDEFKIKVHGSSAHGCFPNSGADALLAAASIAMNLQTMVSREFSPMCPAVVTIGTLHSGTQYNIIAGEAEKTGTCRCFDEEVYDSLPAVMERIVTNTAAALKCSAELEFKRLTPPLSVDDRAYDIMQGAIAKVIPEELRLTGDRLTGGEDFAEYTRLAPAAFMFVAAGGETPLHSCYTHIDENAMENAIAAEVQTALDALEQLWRG